MTTLEAWKKARCNRMEAERWASMLGKESRATARHRGTISAASGSFEIHYQPSDGATNYHNAPDAFKNALGEVIKQDAVSLIAQSIAVLSAKEKVALIACKEELAAMTALVAEAEAA